MSLLPAVVHTSECTFPNDLLGEGWEAYLLLSGPGNYGLHRDRVVAAGGSEGEAPFPGRGNRQCGFDLRWCKVESL